MRECVLLLFVSFEIYLSGVCDYLMCVKAPCVCLYECLLSFFNLFYFERYLSCVCYICLQNHDAVTGMNLRKICVVFVRFFLPYLFFFVCVICECSLFWFSLLFFKLWHVRIG